MIQSSSRFPLRKLCIVLASICVLAVLAVWTGMRVNLNVSRSPGSIVDQFNGVPVYYNGAVGHVDGRSMSADGYNLGLRWQCVEFIKRYYFERFAHRMPDARGNAKDFFDPKIEDGALNPARDLIQYKNEGSSSAPAVDDIIVFAPWLLNPYGHVAIVTRVDDTSVEIVQQNPGPFAPSRERLTLIRENNGQISVKTGAWLGGKVLGWLRLDPRREPILKTSARAHANAA